MFSWFWKNHPLVRLETFIYRWMENQNCYRGTIVDVLRTDVKSDPSIGLAYFFFTFSELEKQTALNMLSSLVAQLFHCLTTTPEGLKAFYFRNPEKPSLRTLLKLFETLLKEFTRTFVVLDALDEVATYERETLLLLLHQMVGGSFENFP